MHVPIRPIAKLFQSTYLALLNWRRHLGWLVVFSGSPWLLFVGIALINPYYIAKFFVPLNDGTWWFGPAMLGAAVIMSLLTLPMSEVSQKLWADPNRNFITIIKLIAVVIFAGLFWVIACSIIVLTPAAITMTEQMRKVP